MTESMVAVNAIGGWFYGFRRERFAGKISVTIEKEGLVLMRGVR